MVDNELITKVRTRNVKSILSNVFTSTGGGGTWGSITGTLSSQTDLQNALNAKLSSLSNGNGTTANGSAVDLGGVINGSLYSGTEIYPDTNNEQNFSIGKNGNAFNQIQFYSGDNGYQMFNNGAATSFTDFGYDGLGGTFSPYNFNVYFNNRLRLKSLSGIIFDFDQTGIKLDLGSDAIGDTYYRNSSGYFTRLPVGTDGNVLTLAAGIPSWAAPSGGSGLTVGTTTITSGTNTRVLYNNSGVLGEYTVSGSGDVAMTTSPTFTTPILGTPTSGTLTNTTGYLFNNLAAATGANTINNAANAQEWQWNTLAAGTGLLLSSSSTAAASNTNTVFRVNQTGANATSTQTTYSGYFSNTKTGTSSTNVGLFTTATGGTTNLALHALGGIRLETTAANFLTIKSSNGSEWWNFDNGRIVYLNTNGSNDRITPTSGTLAFLAANATAIDHYTFTGNNALTATSGTARMMVLSKGITVSSGTTTFSALDITGTYNITGGTLTVNGIKYNPTLTSMTGATHYFLNAASGRVLLGGLPTSSAGLATGELWNNSGVINIV